MIPVVYVAGPYNGPNAWLIEQNVRRAEEVALEVWLLGCAAICPHSNTRFYHNTAPNRVWLDGDLEIVKRCDAVVMTEDWRRSPGATEEHDLAVKLGIRVFYNTFQLEEWLKNLRVLEAIAP